MSKHSMVVRTVSERELQQWDVIEDRLFRAKEEFRELAVNKCDSTSETASALHRAIRDALAFRLPHPQVYRDKQEMAGMLMDICHGLDEPWLEPLADALVASTGQLPVGYPPVAGDDPPVPVRPLPWEPILSFWDAVRRGDPPSEAGGKLHPVKPETREQLVSKLQVAAYIGAERLLRAMWVNGLDTGVKVAEVYVAMWWIVSAGPRLFLGVAQHYRPYADVERECCRSSLLAAPLEDIVRLFIGLSGSDMRKSLGRDMVEVGLVWKSTMQASSMEAVGE